MKKLILPISLLSSLVFIFFGLFYYLFDHYIESVGIEIVSAWAKNEENSILEGNLLSSVTKAQKMLLSSEVVKGVSVLDLTDLQRGPLIEFGEKIELDNPAIQSPGIVSTGFMKKSYSIESPTDRNLKVVFSIFSNRILTLFWATSGVFSVLTIVFSFAIYGIRRKQEVKVEKFALKAKQAAHDLALPIVLLNSLVQTLGEKSQETIKSTIDRINSIADDLTDKKLSNKKSLITHSKNELSLIQKISRLVDEIKIGTNHNVEINFEPSSTMDSILIDQDYMSRIFSNLIQNSIEASANHISISAIEKNNEYVFSITDNGSGIPENILSKIGDENFTFGKTFGTGLGVYAAKKFVSENGGLFHVKSKQTEGTTITISFPANPMKKIVLAEDTKVLVLDDDEIMHKVWLEKLSAIEFVSPVEYFKNSKDLLLRFQQLNRDEVFIFSDYNLGETRSGLDIIEKLDMSQQSALVTAQDFDLKIHERVKRIGTQLIGKSALKDLEIIVI